MPLCQKNAVVPPKAPAVANTIAPLPASPQALAIDPIVQPSDDAAMADDAVVPPPPTMEQAVQFTSNEMEGLVKTPGRIEDVAMTQPDVTQPISGQQSTLDSEFRSTTAVGPLVMVSIQRSDSRPSVDAQMSGPESYLSDNSVNSSTGTFGSSPASSASSPVNTDSASNAPKPPVSKRGNAIPPRRGVQGTAPLSTLGKRRASDDEVKKSHTLLSSSNHSLTSNDFAAPGSFKITGPDFRKQLQKDVFAFVQQADTLVSSQPWLAAFSLSDKPVNNWALIVTSEIMKLSFRFYLSGFDEGFRKAYAELLGWYARCAGSPVAWCQATRLRRIMLY
jgi:hypothetical protein